MNIAIWIYKLGNGGAERVMADLANIFSEDFDVTLLVHSHDGEFRHLIQEHVEVKVLATILPQSIRPRTVFCFFHLIYFILHRKPEIILTTGLTHNVLLILAKLVFKIRSKVFIRETNTLSIQSKLTQSYFYRYCLDFAQFFYPFADQIIAPSTGVATDLKEQISKINQKVTIIPNPIEGSVITSLASQSKSLLLPAIGSNEFILAVGRLEFQKGFQDLIEAWAPLYKKSGINLVILGEGKYRNNLEIAVQDLGVGGGIHLPGFEKNPFFYMKHCSCFVLSSYHEGLPNALMQAMVCGCKIVSTNCKSGPAEILDNGKFGSLVKVGDIDALRNAIEYQLRSPDEYEKQKVERVKKLYGKKVVKELYGALFNELV